MASIIRTSLAMGWDGKQAENGLAKMGKTLDDSGKKAEKVGKKVAETASKSAAQASSSGSMFAGATDLTSVAGMAVSAGNAVLAFAKLGGALETMQIKATYMAGSFKAGVAAIEEMRDASMASGVALADNVKGMNALATAGFSVKASTDTVKSLQNAAELLGEGGMGMLTSSIVSMQRAGVAGEAEFNSLQAAGLKVWEALAENMTKATGKAHSVEDAMAAVRDGTVSAAKGIAAISAAGASDALKEANERFRGSFEGQFKRLVETATETFREISKVLLDAINIPALMAGLRGVFIGVKDIVVEIAKLFGDMMDPKDKAAGIEGTFAALRKMTYDTVEFLSKGINSLKAAFEAMYYNVEATVDKVLMQLRNPLHNTDDYNASVDRLRDTRINKSAENKLQADQAVEEFFNKIRNDMDAKAKAAKPPAKAMFDPAAVAGGVNGNALDKLADAAAKTKLELEAMARATKDFANNTIREMRTPFEVFQHEMGTLGQRMAEAGQAGLNEKDTAAFKEAMARKAGKQLQDLIGANIGGDSMFSAASTRGSAADVEARVRAQYGEQNMSVQEKIRIATERAAVMSERQLEYQRKLVDEAIKQNKMKPVQAVLEK
jgi:hypothetical protein